MSTTGKPTTCDRCGRKIQPTSRRRPVVVCRDCYRADPEYLRLATQHARTKEAAA